MDINDIIEMFNNNDLDVEKYFNDYQTFFNILKKRGLMGELDPKNGVGSEHWQNEYLLWLYENNRDKFNHYVSEFLGDVIFEDGKPILELDNRDELYRLFSDSRSDLSVDTIGSILSDDGNGDAFDRYWETTDDVYRDVIEELNDKNTQRLYEYIVSSLKGKKISPNTDVLEVIAEEQGHPEYVDVNAQTVIKIVDDEESMWQLLHDNLHDLQSELSNIHSNAYNSAYEEEVYEAIWDELSPYFEGHGNWVSRPHSYKKNTKVQVFRIPIRNFDENVVDYLSHNKGYGNSGTLEYIGSYIGMLEESINKLRVRIPDYPSSIKIDENINEFFRDYI